MQCLCVAAFLIPEQQAQHGVIMPPSIPRGTALVRDVGRVARQAVAVRPRAEIAVGVLVGDEPSDKGFKMSF